MHPLAHHAGEQNLLPLLLLGGAWLSLLLTVNRARLAAMLGRFARPARRR